MMRYLLRSLKYFLTICAITALLLWVLGLLGLVGRDVDTLFEKGWTSVGYILLMFAAVSLVYPKLKYTRRPVFLPGETAEIRPVVEREMAARGFRIERDGDEELTFRRADFAPRLNRFFEDRITFTRVADGYEVEGLTRDVVLIVNSLAYRRSGDAEKSES